MTDQAIAARDVGRVYASDSGEVHALREINIEVERGQFVALRGSFGQWQNDTASIASADLDDPTSGRIWIHGVDISTMDEQERVPPGGASASALYSSRWVCCPVFRLMRIWM